MMINMIFVFAATPHCVRCNRPFTINASVLVCDNCARRRRRRRRRRRGWRRLMRGALAFWFGRWPD
jgi:hypothetical protein